MKYFFVKLHPPRPTFMQDITPAEMKLMQEHSGYWRGLMDRGWVAAFGPVVDAGGGYGIGIFELPDDVDPCTLTDADPVVKSQTGFRAEILTMPRAILRKHSAVN